MYIAKLEVGAQNLSPRYGAQVSYMAISVVLRVRVLLMLLPRQRVRDGLHGGGDRRRHGTHDGRREDVATEMRVEIELLSVEI